MELFPSYCLVCDKHIDSLAGDGLYCSSQCRTLDSAPEVLRLKHNSHPQKLPSQPVHHVHHNKCGCDGQFSYPSLFEPLPIDDSDLDKDTLDLNAPLESHRLADVPELYSSSLSDSDDGLYSPPASSPVLPSSRLAFSAASAYPEDIYSRTVMLSRPTASLLAMERP